MKKRLNISTPKELSAANEIIHDCTFNKARISFTPESSNLELIFYREMPDKKKVVDKFLFLKKITVPVLEYRILINHVNSYKILEDTQAGPGSEDILNTATFDEQKKQLLIRTVIAKGIIIDVSKLELSIEETNNVVKEKKRLSL